MMLDRLQAAWPYLRAELLRPMFRQFEGEHEDLAVAVVRTLLVRPAGMRRILQPQGTYNTLDQLLADRDTFIDSATDARNALARIKPDYFLNGRAVGHFLSELPDAFAEYENPALSDYYVERLYRFIEKHMLPYRLDTNPVKLTPLLSADLDASYRAMRNRVEDDVHLRAALRSFENAWSKQGEEWDQESARLAIRAAVDLAEGVSKAATGNQDQTLGLVINRLNQESRVPCKYFSGILQKAYDFTNKYPNIRHVPGEPDCVKRELVPADALVSALVLVGFSGVLHEMCEA
jgi:hypothetical protein